MQPFANDPKIGRFPQFKDKSYEFIVAEGVPGGDLSRGQLGARPGRRSGDPAGDGDVRGGACHEARSGRALPLLALARRWCRLVACWRRRQAIRPRRWPTMCSPAWRATARPPRRCGAAPARSTTSPSRSATTTMSRPRPCCACSRCRAATDRIGHVPHLALGAGDGRAAAPRAGRGRARASERNLRVSARLQVCAVSG